MARSSGHTPRSLHVVSADLICAQRRAGMYPSPPCCHMLPTLGSRVATISSLPSAMGVTGPMYVGHTDVLTGEKKSSIWSHINWIWLTGSIHFLKHCLPCFLSCIFFRSFFFFISSVNSASSLPALLLVSSSIVFLLLFTILLSSRLNYFEMSPMPLLNFVTIRNIGCILVHTGRCSFGGFVSQL